MTAPQSNEADDRPRVTNARMKRDRLILDPRNAKRHPESQIEKIKGSIETFGYVSPLVVRPNKMLIGGEGTLLALKRLSGYETIDVRVVHGLNDLQYAELGLALNKLGDEATYDTAALGAIINDIMAAGHDATDLGFSDKEIAAITGEQDELEVKEIETGEVSDECWVSVRGPLEHQAGILHDLETIMAKYPGVTVELGTIAIG
jgi:ParB-like chromosome segregation protein Spo0J